MALAWKNPEEGTTSDKLPVTLYHSLCGSSPTDTSSSFTFPLHQNSVQTLDGDNVPKDIPLDVYLKATGLTVQEAVVSVEFTLLAAGYGLAAVGDFVNGAVDHGVQATVDAVLNPLAPTIQQAVQDWRSLKNIVTLQFLVSPQDRRRLQLGDPNSLLLQHGGLPLALNYTPTSNPAVLNLTLTVNGSALTQGFQIAVLSSVDGSFAGHAMSLSVNTTVGSHAPVTSGLGGSGSGGSKNVGLIVGVCVACGGVVLVLAAFVVVKRLAVRVTTSEYKVTTVQCKSPEAV